MAEDDALIDWEQLDMVAEGFAPDFVEIYREFLLQTPDLLSELEECLARGEVTGAREAAHKIKGSCANLGFVGVSRPVAEIELRAKERGSIEGSMDQLLQARANFESSAAEVAAKRAV